MNSIVFADGSVRMSSELGDVVLTGAGAYEVARWALFCLAQTKHLPRCPYCDLPVFPWEKEDLVWSEGPPPELPVPAHGGCIADEAVDRAKADRDSEAFEEGRS